MIINFQNLFNSPGQIINLLINLIIMLCVLAVLVSILIDFVEFQNRAGVKKEKKSFVETGTMLLFFLVFYGLIRFNLGHLNINFGFLRVGQTVLGLVVIIIGCIVNISGRLFLGQNWANQIKIYQDHSFVSSGPYQFVRHPLYASIIWMFFGASLVYSNYLAFLATLFIFVPAMYLRAKQEEGFLNKEFLGYGEYQTRVGLFFPKLK